MANKDSFINTQAIDKLSTQKIIDHLPAALVVYRYREDINSLIVIAANNKLKALTGADVEELYNRNLWDLIDARVHFEDKEMVRKAVDKFCHENGSLTYTYRNLNPATGTYGWLNCNAESVLDEDGSRIIFALYTDANLLKKEQERYEHSMHELWMDDPEIILVFHLNLTQNTFQLLKTPPKIVLDLSQAKTADDLIDTCNRAMLYAEDREKCDITNNRKQLLNYVKNGLNQHEATFRYLGSDGTLRWAKVIFKLELNPVTGDYEALGHTIDISKAAEEDAILNHLSGQYFDFIAVIDVIKGTIAFNQFNEDETGTIPRFAANYDEDVTAAIKKTTPPEEADEALAKSTLKAIKKGLEDSPTYSFDCTLRNRHGDLVRKQFRFAYLDKERQHILLTRSDVTQVYYRQKQQMDNLQAAVHQAERANASKGEFMSRLSHDIRTPMNIISGMTEFAYEDLDDKAKIRDDLNKIKAANSFLLSLINDILDLAKIDNGAMELRPSPYFYDEFATNIRNMFEPLCEQKDLHFIMHTEEHVPTIFVDRVRLNQLALNLISNAIKYTPAGGTIEFSAGGTPATKPGYFDAYFKIKDTGIGMSKAFQERMFTPFTQEARKENQDPSLRMKGTGLGLAIVKKIVDLFKGKIQVESNPGKGTTVDVNFTLKIATQEDIEQVTKLAPATLTEADLKALQQRFSSSNMLLVEDHPLNAEIAKRLLDSVGFKVELAVDGSVAVSKFVASPAGKYTAILMDIQMPVMDGYQAAKAIRRSNHPQATTIPILALTADAFSQDEAKALDAGMNGHLAKPIDKVQLFQTLKDLLPEK
jgi:signal transduction histidine kinase/ActR/RegA family two-component response regulator